jgi:hypothetical protein
MKFLKITVFWSSAIQLPRALARGRKIKKFMGFSPIFKFIPGLKPIFKKSR